MLAGVAVPGIVPGVAFGAGAVVDIDMRSDTDGARVWFDPIGLLIPAMTTIRWTTRQNVHTATAYHPDNDNHSLRIPDQATPWDSGYLVNPGDSFEVTLSVPGVYDYYCAPHEYGGMVGRIIVSDPSGPGALAFDYFGTLAPVPDWQEVPDLARANFPSIRDIMANGVVRV